MIYRTSSFFEQDISSIQKVIDAKEHQLLIPPKFSEDEISVDRENYGDAKEPLIGLFSSGSTGQPKTILNAKQRIVDNSRASIEHFGFSKNQKLLILASPWHVAGLTWAMAAEIVGADYQIHAPYADKLESFHALIQEYQPDILCTVPSVLSQLLTYPAWHVPHIIAGGASLQPELYQKLENVTERITQAYGQTESGGLISSISLRPSEADPETDYHNVGQTLSEISLKLQDSTDSVAESQIVLNSPYAIEDDDYVTGDLGFIDSDGNLHITGRSDKKDGGNCNALSGMTMVLHK